MSTRVPCFQGRPRRGSDTDESQSEASKETERNPSKDCKKREQIKAKRVGRVHPRIPRAACGIHCLQSSRLWGGAHRPPVFASRGPRAGRPPGALDLKGALAPRPRLTAGTLPTTARPALIFLSRGIDSDPLSFHLWLTDPVSLPPGPCVWRNRSWGWAASCALFTCSSSESRLCHSRGPVCPGPGRWPRSQSRVASSLGGSPSGHCFLRVLLQADRPQGSKLALAAHGGHRALRGLTNQVLQRV